MQEPVAYLCENGVGHRYFRWKKPSDIYKPIALYTTSPAAQRPWVGLTKVQRDDFADAYGSYEAVCAIEQRLKELNT